MKDIMQYRNCSIVKLLCLPFFVIMMEVEIQAQNHILLQANSSIRANEEPKLCGGYRIDSAALKAALDFESQSGRYRLSRTEYLIRIYFHICRDNDGSSAAATAVEIQSEFEQLVSDYSSYNICFIKMGTDSIDNTQINRFNTANEALLNPHLVPNCINIFYHFELNNGSGSIGGSAYDIPNTYFSVVQNNIGIAHTIAHEMGHCLGLFHTFENWGGTSFENIDGSNSSTAADKISDTPADPFAYGNDVCYSFSAGSCVYNGTCRDPKGATNFSPPYTNVMSYWGLRRSNLGTFCFNTSAITSNQYDRINSSLSTDNDLIGCISPPVFPIGPANTFSGYFITSALILWNVPGVNTTIGGTTIAAIGGQEVTLYPDFLAAPTGNGSVLITASDCDFSALKLDYNSNPSVSINKPIDSYGEKRVFQIYPNPFSSTFEISITLSQDEQVNVILYNSLGAKIKDLLESSLTNGNNKFAFDGSGLAPGVYLIEINVGGERSVRRLVKV